MFYHIILLLLSSIFDSISTVHLLNTTSGIYVGRTVKYRNTIVQQYLGIEYGRISKRFERAEPIIRQNDSVINATSFGSVCKPTISSCTTNTSGLLLTTSCAINYGIFSIKSKPTEQCLFLNIFIPMTTDNNNNKINNKTKKAIYIWIHGGSGQVGTGNIFDGTIFAALGDIIVVTFNYRLNLFGFLSSGDERLEGNLGLYDQLMVLDWIYNNSKVLGGDIQRITIGGHSAGAPYAYYLALSPFNRGRIRRLILQSGCPFNIWSHIKADQAMEKFNIVAHDNQCEMMITFDEKLKCLREKDYHSIVEHEHYSYTSANHTNVVINGNYMNRFQEELHINDTSLANIDILMGSNDDEGIYVAIVPILIEQPDDEFIILNNMNFTEISLKFLATMQPNKTCLHKQALELYHIHNMLDDCYQSPDCYCSAFYNYSRLISDVLFLNDYYRFLTHRIKSSSNRTFLYQYSYRTSQEHPTLCNDYLRKHNLVGHFAELEYTWGTPLLFQTKKLIPLIQYTPYEKMNYTNEQIEFSQQIIEQWSNFIKYGKPYSKKFQYQWKPFMNISNGTIMHLKLNQSEIKQFEIPSNILFWMNECLTVENNTIIDLNNQQLIDDISLTVFICTTLLVISFTINMSRTFGRRFIKHGLLLSTSALGTGYFGQYLLEKNKLKAAEPAVHKPEVWLDDFPTREVQIDKMSNESEYDIVVIGGGATGCGVAVDAASRGLKVALVEKYDFSSGTSSRSTKLIHGGVRYLQKAIMQFDREQYHMVKEALYERGNLLKIAPHLSYPLPIMLPIYKWYLLPYYYVGLKAYDFVSGRQLLRWSYIISKKKALELFPMLKKEKLVGGIVYYDGQHNDARMNIALAFTAARMGANIANHCVVTELIHENIRVDNDHGQPETKKVIRGVKCFDRYQNKEFTIRTKCVVNATGPYTDEIRHLDDKSMPKICQPSAGVHIVLPDYYSPNNMGLLDPNTSDGRVIFFLPWQKHTMAGTTDTQCDVTDYPSPSTEDVDFILGEVKNYLSSDVQVRRGDILAAWSGIRPLVLNPNKKDTQSIARNHIIHVSDSGLVTVGGGKWTTYRQMAEETVDRCVESASLKTKNGCVTKGLILNGGEKWTPTSFIRLVQDYGVDTEVAIHLSNTYGDQAHKVADLSSLTGKRWPVIGKRLHEEFPYIEAEISYAIKEYARTAVDILARRTRLSFLNVIAAEEALPNIIQIMAKELHWDEQKQKEETDRAKTFLLREMGLNLKRDMRQNVPIDLTREEMSYYMKYFRQIDVDNKGFCSHRDLKRYLQKSNNEITDEEFRILMQEVDQNQNGIIETEEFLQLMSAIKSGNVTSSHFPKAAKIDKIKTKLSPERSGGGI
ncbi:unnamed protein product [Adineta steineri]|uniref:Glycerol-3-phosphate dehydrogenase n=2 Tax=Adineta steineri TaxID=433720 RepID=A0A818V7U7_9BILA|nr:unnamed protein product [Adineta steineri]